jgi:hypothetical protein
MGCTLKLLLASAVLMLLSALSGCAGDQRDRFAEKVSQAAPRSEAAAARAEDVSSNNATQQSLTGLGANVAKLAEKLDASLLRVEARLDALAQTQASAQVGIGSRMDTLQQNVSAGRDSSVTTDFTREMKDTLIKSYSTILWIVTVTGALAVLAVALADASRRRELLWKKSAHAEVGSG